MKHEYSFIDYHNSYLTTHLIYFICLKVSFNLSVYTVFSVPTLQLEVLITMVVLPKPLQLKVVCAVPKGCSQAVHRQHKHLAI